jgi:hypothetical protein
MRGLIKPMPDYRRHNLVGVTIPAEGREFIVDDKAAAAFEPLALLERVAASDLDEDGKALARREVLATQRSGFCDEPGKPLLLTSKAFAWIKERIGTAVIVEPIGGDGLEAIEALSRKSLESEALRQELQRNAQALAELEASRQALAEQAAQRDREYEVLKSRLAELDGGGRKR